MRSTDGTDEPWGIVGLAAAIGFLVREGRLGGRGSSDTAADRPRLALATLFTVTYAAAYPFAPALLRALIAMAAFAITLVSAMPRRGPRAAIMGLCVISVPLVASLQFYLGYPLRRATGALAVVLLRPAGFTVAVEGTMLRWDDKLIAIDAPCSGVRLLWVVLFLTFVVAGALRLDVRRTFILASMAVAAVVPANAMRVAALFFSETGMVTLPSWAHEGTGLACLLLVGAVFAHMVDRLDWRDECA